MSIAFRILGEADADNALLVEIDSGQSVERLLFDCGEACLAGVPFTEILAIDHIFFSHFHMDHVGGFDTLFRALFNRSARANVIWGPPETSRIMHHRFQGYLWNLHEGFNVPWHVIDIHPGELRMSRFELQEAFAVAHDEGRRPWSNHIFKGAGFTLEAMTMDHRTPSMAYIVREPAKHHIDMTRVAALGLKPGSWMQALKDAPEGAGELAIEGSMHSVADLRRHLLVESAGDSIAYLTDFLLDESSIDRVAAALNGCRTLVCEGQYSRADVELADRHYHMTTVRSAALAKRAGAEQLILFHISDRYDRKGWIEMLREAREVFPNTRYPGHWELEEQ